MSYLALECPWVNFSRQQAGWCCCPLDAHLAWCLRDTPQPPWLVPRQFRGRGHVFGFLSGLLPAKKSAWAACCTPAGCMSADDPPYTSPAECHWGWTKPTSTAPLMQLQGNSGMKSMPHVPVVCSGYYRPTTPRPSLQYAPCSLSHMQRGTKRVARICMCGEAPHAGHGHHSLLNHHMMHHSAQCNPQNTTRTRHPSQLGAAVSRRGPISARRDTSGTAGSLAPTSHSPRSPALEIGAAHMHTSIMPQHASADSPDRPLGGLQCPLIGMRSGSRRHKWTALTTSCLNQPVFVAERARGSC